MSESELDYPEQPEELENPEDLPAPVPEGSADLEDLPVEVTMPKPELKFRTTQGYPTQQKQFGYNED